MSRISGNQKAQGMGNTVDEAEASNQTWLFFNWQYLGLVILKIYFAFKQVFVDNISLHFIELLQGTSFDLLWLF